MSGAAGKEMPSEYVGLDSVATADGRFYSAHARVTLARNMTKVYGQGRRLVCQAFPMTSSTTTLVGLGAVSQWVRPPIWRVHKTPGIRFAAVAIRGLIANTKVVRIQFASKARPLNADPATAANVDLTGDGTFKRYPTSGYWLVPLDPGGEDEISLYVWGNDNGTTTDNLGNSSGTITGLQEYENTIVLAAIAADWSNVVPGSSNHYIAVRDAALTLYRGPVLRPVGLFTTGAPATSIELTPPVRGIWRVATDVWQLRQSTRLELQSVSIYEHAPTSEATGL